MDLIDRQAAIDALEKAMCEDGFRSETGLIHKTTAYEIIRHLPSAQPEINCSEFPNNSDTISRQDAVSRRRLLSDLKELITAWEKYPVMAEQIKGVEVAIGYVELIPSAQPETHEERTETHDVCLDTISRQAAIDFIDAGHLCNPNEPRWSDNEIVNFLKSRPSAQPQITHCAECIHWKHSDVRKNYCEVFDWTNTAEDFCSFAERRTDE